MSEVVRNRLHDINEYGVDTKEFVIYLQGAEEWPTEDYIEPGVEYRMANRLIRNLDILMGISYDHPIIISMKTNGGDWAEGMAIYDAILAAPNPTTIVNYTHARSMSSIIFQAANKRVMMPHSTFMFHDGTLGVDGTLKQVYSSVDFAHTEDEKMMRVYVDALRRTPHGNMHEWSDRRIRTWLRKQMDTREDVYMTAEQAVEAGFADGIFTSWEDVTDYAPYQLTRK